ncbi:Radial spoke head protein 3 [Homalodisca vitripennis]|nr:Radial spoke head protein 3 [Homalodisca vitripennis]
MPQWNPYTSKARLLSTECMSHATTRYNMPQHPHCMWCWCVWFWLWYTYNECMSHATTRYNMPQHPHYSGAMRNYQIDVKMWNKIHSACREPLPAFTGEAGTELASPSSEKTSLRAGCESQAARQAEARRRSMARRKAQTQQTRAMRLRIGTPPPVDGRNHVIVQTDQFMEELFDHPPGATVSCQTDFFLDRPETPIYVPSKTGRDAETQIYPGELFHFDTEVQPILEVLVGKTVEQALVEVMEEDELAAIREQQRRYKEIRAAEKAEEQRLEEQERRRREEAAKRVEELELTNRIRLETEDRVSAAVLTQGYLTDLLPSVLEGLKEAGYFIDDIREDVEENFMSWLMGEVRQEMQRMVDNRDLLSEIVREILETRAEVYRAMATDKPGPGSDEEPTSTPLPGVSSVVLHKDENTEETDETGETKPKEETEVRQSAGDDEPTAES